MIASSDLSRARSGHSFALGLATMGAELVYVGTSVNPRLTRTARYEWRSKNYGLMAAVGNRRSFFRQRRRVP